MAKALRKPATYDDLLKVPDHLVAELIDGELYATPRPAKPHSRAHSMLLGKLNGAFDWGDGGPGGWWIVTEPELHFGRDVVVPDIGGWRRERVPEYPDAGACDVAPDWICEVVSPSSGRHDRIRKMPVYARHAVAYAWLIDPVQKSLEVFRLSHGQWVTIATHAEDEVVRAEPFDAIELPLAALWLD
ncbi:MAG TPA: Uma2 family endonuclease [Thermoanaerobaculia bacterium]